MPAPNIVIGLSAVIVCVSEEAPFVLTTAGANGERGLPFGPFDPAADRTLELSLRRWVSEQTGFEIGYAEQLYTFADRGREAAMADTAAGGAERVVSVGYLALTPDRPKLSDRGGADWRDWYRCFPWEDWRNGRPKMIDAEISPLLMAWADSGGANNVQRRARARLAFALDGAPWNEERALDRYELLYEADLVREASRDRARFSRTGEPTQRAAEKHRFGDPMTSDHRRILATAVARLRGKLKYRPIVFELTPDKFTLSRLQKVVEAISGLELHKQNFRRLLDRSGLVVGVGEMEAKTGGRPAELYRFRREALAEGPVGGIHVPAPRR
jgi:hypothetical protein